MLTLEYIQGADLPDATFEWRDRLNNLVDFSIAHTWQLKVGQSGSTAVMTKTTGISGAATAPNVTISWDASVDLNTLDPGSYEADLIATRTSDSRQRKLRFALKILPPIT
jgi:hypothetical protein